MTTINEFNQKRQKLALVSPEELENALMDLSLTNESVENRINSLISTPAENLKTFKACLSGLKRRRKFYDWRDVKKFSNELI